MAPVLGYWNIRGLATPVRLLLEMAGVEYEEKFYECGPPPEFERAAWLAEKFTLGLDFPNLPYYVDDEVKLSQSHVILRYLARKHKLDGNNEQERLRADLVATQTMDYHMDYARTVAYNPEHEKNKAAYQETAAARFKALADFLGDRKFFAGGDQPTYADLVVYEYLAGQSFYNPEALKDTPTLRQFFERVEALEPVKKYFSSPKAVKAPFNGGPAFVGGPYSEMLAAKK